MNPNLKLALAVAASAGFPPLLSPARIKPPKGAIWSWGEATTLTQPGFTKQLLLTDGGVYDNLGLETAWKEYTTVLVSDGGGLMGPVRAEPEQKHKARTEQQDPHHGPSDAGALPLPRTPRFSFAPRALATPTHPASLAARSEGAPVSRAMLACRL